MANYYEYCLSTELKLKKVTFVVYHTEKDRANVDIDVYVFLKVLRGSVTKQKKYIKLGLSTAQKFGLQRL